MKIQERILLVEDKIVISNDREIGTVFSWFFNTITNSLNIPQWNSVFLHLLIQLILLLESLFVTLVLLLLKRTSYNVPVQHALIKKVDQ